MQTTARVGHRLVGTRVRRILRGSITITAGNLSATDTLPYAVNPLHARLRKLGSMVSDPGTGGTGTSPLLSRLEFTNPTTITAIRTGTDNAVVVGYEVIPEWPGTFRVLHRDTVATTPGGTTGTKTIPRVDLDKVEIELLGFSGGVAYNPPDFYGRIDVTDPTTVTLLRQGTSLTLTAGFQISERY